MTKKEHRIGLTEKFFRELASAMGVNPDAHVPTNEEQQPDYTVAEMCFTNAQVILLDLAELGALGDEDRDAFVASYVTATSDMLERLGLSANRNTRFSQLSEEQQNAFSIELSLIEAHLWEDLVPSEPEPEIAVDSNAIPYTRVTAPKWVSTSTAIQPKIGWMLPR
jgi:hypothetical protein